MLYMATPRSLIRNLAEIKKKGTQKSKEIFGISESEEHTAVELFCSAKYTVNGKEENG